MPTTEPSPPAHLPEKRMHGRSLSFGGPMHARTVSYEEMHQLGLGKAIDVYHQLLETAQHNSRAHRPTEHALPPTPLACFLASVIAPPVPRYLRPEVLANTIALVWVTLASLIHTMMPFLVPVCVWATLVPATGMKTDVPLIFRRAIPFLDERIELGTGGSGARILCALVMIAVLKAADATVSAQRLRTSENTSRALTHEALEAAYAGWSLHSENVGEEEEVKVAEAEVVDGVRELMRAYGSQKGAPSHIATLDDAITWLVIVTKEVGVEQVEGLVSVSCRRRERIASAATALRRVRRAILA